MAAADGDTSAASSEIADGSGAPEPIPPNGERTTGLRTAVVKWLFNASTVYAVTLGLSYELVRNLAPQVRDDFVELALTLIGAVGIIMALRGLFRRRTSTAKWERVVATAVLLSVVAVPVTALFKSQKQKELVALTHSRLQQLIQAFNAQVKAAGVPDLFEMLGGQKQYDIAKVVETRGHMSELAASLEKTGSSAEGYLQECRREFSPTDRNSVFLQHLSTKLIELLSVKREYFAEITRLLDFLISNQGTYTISPQGPTFRNQRDVETYSAFVNRIIKYEEQLAASAADIQKWATSNSATEDAGAAKDEMLDAFIAAKRQFARTTPDYRDSLMGAYQTDSVTAVGTDHYSVTLKYDSKQIRCEVDQTGSRCSQ
jgi:hypothetical protein